MRYRARILAVSLLALSCMPEAPPASGEADETAPADRIGIAMSGAPAAISAEATIMDWDESGGLVELRAGTNDWMCMPDDNPAAPGNAPICVDQAWQQWFGAYMNRTTPEISGVGISYMLQGGSAASNTDPFASEPPAGEDWLYDGPHMMVVVPDPAMLDAFPTDPASGGPYVMWKGTPYAHLMVPATPN